MSTLELTFTPPLYLSVEMFGVHTARSPKKLPLLPGHDGEITIQEHFNAIFLGFMGTTVLLSAFFTFTMLQLLQIR